MRLLHLVPHLGSAGGVESYLRRLVAGLAGRRHQVMADRRGGPGTAGIDARPEAD